MTQLPPLGPDLVRYRAAPFSRVWLHAQREGQECAEIPSLLGVRKLLGQSMTGLGTEILGEILGGPEVVAAVDALVPSCRLPERAGEQPVEVTLVLRQGQSPALLPGPEPEQGGPAAAQPGGL